MSPKYQESTDINLQIEPNASVRHDLKMLHDDVEKTIGTQQELKTVQKWIIEDALRNTNMTPEQINTNASLLKTLGIWAAVFFGVKRLRKWSWEGDKTNFPTRALTLIWGLLWANMLSQALTWKSWGTLIKQIADWDISLSDIMNGKTALPESRRGNVEVTSGVLRDLPYPILAQYTTRGSDDMPRVDLPKLHEGLSIAYAQETDMSKKEQLGQKLQMIKWLLDERDWATYMDKTLYDMGITKTILDRGTGTDNLNTVLDGWKKREADLALYENMHNMILKDKKDISVLSYLQSNKPSLQDLIARNYFLLKSSEIVPWSAWSSSGSLNTKTPIVDNQENKTTTPTPSTDSDPVKLTDASNTITKEPQNPLDVKTTEKVDEPIIITPEKTVTDEEKVLRWNTEWVAVLQSHNLALIADKLDVAYIDKKTSRMDIRWKGWYSLFAHEEEVYVKGVRSSWWEVLWEISMPHNKVQVVAPVQCKNIEDVLTLAHLTAYIQHLNRQDQKPEYIKQELEKGVQTLPDDVDKKGYTDWTLSIDK
jgi:hypothetical protein